MQDKQISSREALNERVDAVVVGAGFAGMYMVHKLRELGFSVLAFDAGADVGGTWYWNRYPGARCDLPSQMYAYTFSRELLNEWRWSEKYAAQPEILDYARHVAERFDLRRSFRFNTRVTSATFDESNSRWTVETDSGDRIDAQFCVMATGCLSVPRVPDYPGLTDFTGPVYITGLWPHEGVDFTGKRVAVIGTGSSGVQSIPLIAKEASHTYVFQRTPNFCVPAQNRPLSDAEVEGFRQHFDHYKAAIEQGTPGFASDVVPLEWQPDEAMWRQWQESCLSGAGIIGVYGMPNLMRNPQINETASEWLRDQIRATVKDPAVAKKLLPYGYPLAAKRSCVDSGYHDTFNRPDVTLIDLHETPIERLTATGIDTSAEHFDVDAVVMATGFDAMTGAMLKIDIRGRDGLALRDAWADGPNNYLGLAVAGFPNLFFISGPGSPSVLSSCLTTIEQHVEWIGHCCDDLRSRHVASIEASRTAQDDWVEFVNVTVDKTLFPLANSWYIGANVPGKPRVFSIYVGGEYNQRCQSVAANGYEGFELQT